LVRLLEIFGGELPSIQPFQSGSLRRKCYLLHPVKMEDPQSKRLSRIPVGRLYE
jgi:hypothetical protein